MKQLKGIIISIIAILSILVAVYEVLVPEETSVKKRIRMIKVRISERTLSRDRKNILRML